MNTSETEGEIRKAVKDRYAKLATTNRKATCCPTPCCGEQPSDSQLVSEAAQISAGCGSPVENAGIKEGMLVVDLGSGGGVDVFRAAKLVGSRGRVIGVDSTPEMVWRAREIAKKHGCTNVEFRLGEIEHLPVDPESVDTVISNCVINLAPDKAAVYKEIFRVLKPGGKLVVSDIATKGKIPERIRRDMSSWSECISGALPEMEYEAIMGTSGFSEIKTLEKRIYPINESGSTGRDLPQLFSVTISATKPVKM